MLTIDLDPETEQRLDEVCRRTGVTPSAAVKRSLADWLEHFDSEIPDAYELGKDLFGQGGPAEPPSDPYKKQIWGYLHRRDFDVYRTPDGQPFERLWLAYGV